MKIVSISFASSGMAQGLISTGLSFFGLIYYSQVLGLDPSLAGLAMMIALVVDAISDPLIGAWSDRIHTRWGRRHPFLFASILPIAATYYFLWDVPELSQAGLFAYLVTLTVILRLSLTLHVVPYNALLPEITSSYEERTRLMSYSTSSAYFAGTLLAVLMYAYWLADAPGAEIGSGILRRSGYVKANQIASIVALIGLIVSAVGTFKRFQKSAPAVSLSPRDSLGEEIKTMISQVKETLNDRNFLVMVISGLTAAMASGTYGSLWAYMQPYFWGFGTEQTSVILIAQLLSAFLAFTLIRLVSRGREKKVVLIWLSLFSLFVSTGPVFLHLLEWFPPRGSSVLFYTMVTVGVIQVMLTIMTWTLTSSMIADIVEARAVATHRREEGLLFSVLSFIGKVAGGAGVWTGGFMLAYINFPADVTIASMPAELISQLGWLYVTLLAVFYLASILALFFYRLTRAQHEEHVNALRES